MAGDNLFDILDMVRAELPFKVSDEAWAALKLQLSRAAGGERAYVPAQRKRCHLETMAEIGENADAQQLSKLLGVSVRRVQQLKKLRH